MKAARLLPTTVTKASRVAKALKVSLWQQQALQGNKGEEIDKSMKSTKGDKTTESRKNIKRNQVFQAKKAMKVTPAMMETKVITIASRTMKV